MVPDFDVELVFAGGNCVFLGRELEFTVDGEIILAFGGNSDCLLMVESESLRELDGDIVRVLLPERWKHGTALGATVVEDVAEPDFEVARIPDPGGLLTFGY